MKLPCNMKVSTSTLLTGLSILGLAGTTYSAVKATNKAIKLIEESDKTPVKELCLTYAPTALLATATVACICGINIAGKKTNASMAAAYSMLNRSFNDYKEAVVEIHGTDEDVIKRVAEKRIAKDRHRLASLYRDKNDDERVFYDELTGTYFTALYTEVLTAELETNRIFNARGEVTADEFYEKLGIHTAFGDMIGWDSYTGEYAWGYTSVDTYIVEDVLEDTNQTFYILRFVCGPHVIGGDEMEDLYNYKMSH